MFILFIISFIHWRMKNYYSILQVEELLATQVDIRKAYKRLVITHHPDKTDDAQLIKKGIEINQAYKTLVSQPLREEYDARFKQKNKQLARATSRHYEVISSGLNKLEQLETQGVVSIDCEQCFGNTEITLTQQDAHYDKFVNCSHCGLLMKIE